MKNKLNLLMLIMLAMVPIFGFANINNRVVYLILPDIASKTVSVDYDIINNYYDEILNSITSQHFETTGPMKGIMAIGAPCNTHIKVKSLTYYDANDKSTITYAIADTCSVYNWIFSDYNALEFKSINNYMMCTKTSVAIDI